ncbi:MAG TPA: peptidylprolyl isomerase [Candidatus Cloacimonadota bacterium]|nr:peptidylprolyl isomerase [Candidatus Cloacimonadota bacterium]
MFKILKACLMLVVVCLLAPAYGLHFARWDTSMGSFTAEIYNDLMPITGENFINLTNNGFYNDLIFHRVVSGFVIQDGCPNGTGTGGPGYTIQDEYHPSLIHDRAGMLAMAKTSQPNSAGSQYYFTLAPQPHLDGHYAVFGKVVQNLDVVLAIGQVPVGANNRPITPVTINELRMLDLMIDLILPANDEVVQCSAAEDVIFAVVAYSGNHDINYTWKVDDEVVLQGVNEPTLTHRFPAGTHILSCTVENVEWSHTVIWQINSSGNNVADDVLPAVQAISLNPNPFREGTEIKLSSPLPQRLKIYDLKGRLIRDFGMVKDELFWDGRDSQQRNCAAGTYLFKYGDKCSRGVLLK